MSTPLLQKSLVEIKLGEYGTANATALSDPLILSQVQNYKRTVASRMVPLSKDDITRKIPEAEYLVSRKIDGEFTGLVCRDGEVLTVNPGGTVRVGLPWQKEAAELLAKAGVTNALLAGELYVEVEDRRPRVHDVVSLARQPDSKEDLAKIRFAVFDWVELDGELLDEPYDAKFERIRSVFSEGQSIHPVETVAIKGDREIVKKFEEWVEGENAEGLVVRSDSAGSFKVKPRHTLDAVVIGFTESTGDRVGMLHDLLLGVVRTDGAIHCMCRVGGGFSDEQRREMLSDLQDMVVESEYAEVNSDHVAYQMVKPEWVIEISCLDMISQNTRGGPVNRMVLNWNSDTSRYEVIRRMPLVSVISPQFIQIRDDKSCNPDDVRIGQLADIVPILSVDADAKEMSLPKSELLEREVYTKTLKGELMVRKFALWRTNKESEGEDYPAFVVHYTDFSPARKVPLTREVRISNSESQIRELLADLKKANIKKGWSPIDA